MSSYMHTGQLEGERERERVELLVSVGCYTTAARLTNTKVTTVELYRLNAAELRQAGQSLM